MFRVLESGFEHLFLRFLGKDILVRSIVSGRERVLASSLAITANTKKRRLRFLNSPEIPRKLLICSTMSD